MPMFSESEEDNVHIRVTPQRNDKEYISTLEKALAAIYNEVAFATDGYKHRVQTIVNTALEQRDGP